MIEEVEALSKASNETSSHHSNTDIFSGIKLLGAIPSRNKSPIHLESLTSSCAASDSGGMEV
nr:hypothetical protein [uncultured Acetobacterium sp.]